MNREAVVKRRPGSIFVATILIGVFVTGEVIAKSHPHERIVKITAQRFSYSPGEIRLKKGEPVVLRITSLDFMHGFKVPDLDIRVDLPPGKVTEVRLTPEKAGVYDFLCDNFCGSGHEEMNGRIVVTD